MMNCLMILLMMNDYLYKSSEVFINMDESFDDFCAEAEAIEYVKCILINNQELSDFSTNYSYVSVYKDGDIYYLNYDDVKLKVETKDNLIYDYSRE